MQKYSTTDRIVMGVIALFYIVGAFQLGRPEMRAMYAGLTPLVLLFSMLFLAIYDRSTERPKLLLFALIVALASFGVEVWGVATGYVFGGYEYGNELGTKFAETPLLIGLNWILLVYMSGAMVDALPRKPLYAVALPSALMIGYDIVMEQVAPRMDMWSWEGDVIPMQNYVVWGILALLFHTIRYLMKIPIRNRMAGFLFVIQVLFFAIILMS